jgi:flagellar hook assembly protein FlgD
MVVASSGDEVSISTIDEFNLLANYPNPFNPSTTISYGVDMDAIVNVSIYNVYGQLVETLVNEYKNAGIHTIVWNAENHANGMYILKLNSPYTSEVKKITLLK